MSEDTQIGPSVDRELWQRFREDVRERHGRVRGVLGKELETAIRQHLSDDASPTERRLEQRLIRIEDALEVADTDGGTTVSEGEDTHTHRIDVDTKPDAKAARDRKVAYLAECILDEVFDTDTSESADALESVPRSTLRDVIKAEYGFRRDTAAQYVADLRDHFDLVAHPNNDVILITRDKRADIVGKNASEQLSDSTQVHD
jgi:hypothetical protein